MKLKIQYHVPGPEIVPGCFIYYMNARDRYEPFWFYPDKADEHEHRWCAYFRYPQYANEQRQWDNAIDQGVTPRRRRSPNMLLTEWDDISNGRYRARNWKDSHRCKKQWMKNL